ncbi:MAG: hypothetical protein ABI947_14540, partial [Chloroflexota bacterium]
KVSAHCPFWRLLSLAELAYLLNIAWPTPSLGSAFRLAWWSWWRAIRMTAIRSRYRHEPTVLYWLRFAFQLRL